MLSTRWLIVTLCSTMFPDRNFAALDAEQRLMQTLLKKYDRVGVDARPGEDASRPLPVQLDLEILQVDDVSVERNSVTLVATVDMTWSDNVLTWNRSQEGLTSLAVGADRMWTPDVVISNMVSPPVPFYSASQVRVSWDGTSSWHTKHRYTLPLTHATPDGNFQCDIVLSSLTRDAAQLSLQSSDAPRTHVVGQWNMSTLAGRVVNETVRKAVFSTLVFPVLFSPLNTATLSESRPNDEQRLVVELESRYDGSDNKVWSGTSQPEVGLMLSPLWVNSVDEAGRSVTLVIHSRLTWQDALLVWDRNMSDADSVWLDADSVWTPDITQLDSVAPSEPLLPSDQVEVSADGKVTWQQRHRYTHPYVSNSSDTEVICHMSFGSYRKLSLSGDSGVSVDDYIPSPHVILRDWSVALSPGGENVTASPSVMMVTLLLDHEKAAPASPGSEHQTPEQRLLRHLVAKHGAPTGYGSDNASVVVSRLSLLHINDFDPDNLILEFTAKAELSWESTALQWSPGDYNNLSQVRIPTGQLWNPDIGLLNAVAPSEEIHDIRLLVTSNGSVTSVRETRERIACEAAIDETLCVISLASMSMDASEVVLDVIERDGNESAPADVHHSSWTFRVSPAVVTEDPNHYNQGRYHSVMRMEIRTRPRNERNPDHLNNEQLLIGDVTKQYSTSGPEPRGNLDLDAGAVDFLFSIIHLQEFDQENQFLVFAGRTVMNWTDAQLRWDPEEYGGIQSLFMDARLIWTPDVTALYSISPPEVIHDTSVQVQYDGAVTSVRETRESIGCRTEVDEDRPVCSILFSSLTMDAQRLKLGLGGRGRFDTSKIVSHHTWEILNAPATVSEMQIFGVGEKYSIVQNKMLMRRRAPRIDPNSHLEDAAPSTATASCLWLVTSLIVLGQSYL